MFSTQETKICSNICLIYGGRLAYLDISFDELRDK